MQVNESKSWQRRASWQSSPRPPGTRVSATGDLGEGPRAVGTAAERRAFSTRQSEPTSPRLPTNRSIKQSDKAQGVVEPFLQMDQESH